MRLRLFHRRQPTIIGWVAIALALLIPAFVLLQPDENLHLVFCNVGQGEAILIVKGSQQALIDGGPTDTLLECLNHYVPFWDRELELVVLTNGDADHLTGLIEVLGRFEVGYLVANNLVKETERFKAFRQTVQESGVSVYAPKAGDLIRLGTKGETSGVGELGAESLVLQVLWPNERLGNQIVWSESADERVLGANTYSQSKANEQSVVLALHYRDFDALLTGDIGFETETKLLDSGLLDDAEVLKVGHHGSKYSSSSDFLAVVRPQIAVISVGKNRYGHPTQEAIDRLKAVGARVLRTDQEGNVEIVTDGESFWINQ